MMQYSLFDELVGPLRFEALDRPELRHAMEARALFPRAGAREAIASALVRLGVLLDRAAGERVLSAAAPRSSH
ncbi:MAG TPA: hypothetical protein VFY79_12355 [Dehalococcoidia bacterium]|nr:hypothetical protein [Dehalococcoidia bacterium]